MDRSLLRRGPLSVGVLGSSLPLLVLLGSSQLSTAHIAAIQLVIVWAIQFMAIVFKTDKRKAPAAVLAPPVQVAVPAEVTLEQALTAAEVDRKERKRAAAEASSRTSSSSRKARASAAAAQAALANDDALEQPAVLESQLSGNDLLPAAAATARPARIPKPEHPMYGNALLDGTLAHFLAVLDPSQLQYLPASPDPSTLAAPVPLAAWEQLLTSPTCSVAKHPTIPHLYSISAAYPDVPLRNLWELMIDIENRSKWDSMCYATEQIEAMALSQSHVDVHTAERQASVDYLATKGMFPVKANDMVLLSVNATLTPTATAKTRLVCATTSVEHPSKPPTRSYTRMSLSISGFVAEDDGQGGSRVTQLTDLSALGSWVPTRIIKMVTETMIPRSLVKIGQTAKEFVLTGPRAHLLGQDWLPPVIGSWEDQPEAALPLSIPVTPTTLVGSTGSKSHAHARRRSRSSLSSSSSRSSRTAAAGPTSPSPRRSARKHRCGRREEREPDSDVDDSLGSDSDNAAARRPASSSREMRELVQQLRSVNNRLSSLERKTNAQASVSADGTAASSSGGGAVVPNGTYDHPVSHPPLAPFGVSRVTDNAVTAQNQPMGWMASIANTLSLRSFLGGLGAGIFSTTTAATLAAFVVYYLRKRRA